MPYELPTPAFNARLYAENRVVAANAFRSHVIQQFTNQYEEFWGLNREEVGLEEMQLILNELGSVAVEILTDAAVYAAALFQNYPGELAEKYLTAPYSYTTDTGAIVLTELKEVWQPVVEEEPGDAEPPAGDGT